MKVRSMRDNLIFKGIQEYDESSWSCEVLIKNFIKDKIGITRDIPIVRAHRLGRRNTTQTENRERGDQSDKDIGLTGATGGSGETMKDSNDTQIDRQKPDQDRPRPIVVKFERYKDREMVRLEAPVALKYSTFYVDEQFPIEVEKRRRILYPIRGAAKWAGDDVKLVVDRLYINGELYVPGKPVSKTMCFALRRSHDPEQLRKDQKARAIRNAGSRPRFAVKETPTVTDEESQPESEMEASASDPIGLQC